MRALNPSASSRSSAASNAQNSSAEGIPSIPTRPLSIALVLRSSRLSVDGPCAAFIAAHAAALTLTAESPAGALHRFLRADDAEVDAQAIDVKRMTGEGGYCVHYQQRVARFD